MYESLDVLLKRSCHCTIGNKAFRLDEPTVRQYFAVVGVLSKIFYSLAAISKLNMPVTTGLQYLKDILLQLAPFVSKVIDIDKEDFKKITMRQLVFIMRFLMMILMETKKVELANKKSTLKSKSKKSRPISMLTIFEKFSAAYNWMPDEIFDKLTMRQLYAYWDEMQYRESNDMKFIAQLHGAKIKDGQSSGANADIEDVRAARALGMQVFAKDEVSQAIGVSPGELKKLKHLLIYMGIPYPDDLIFNEQETNLRNIIFTQIKALKEINKWEPPNFSIEPTEQVLGIKKGDIEGIKKIAKNYGMPIADGFNWKKQENQLRQILCITKRRKDQYLPPIKPQQTKIGDVVASVS